jgi:hypothetical protein
LSHPSVAGCCRKLAGQAAVLISIALWPGDLRAGTIYLISGFENYHHIELEIGDGKVVGEMRPALGYATPPIKVDGTNTTEGFLDLSFHLPAGDRQVVVKKELVGKSQLTWASEGAENKISFYRDLRAPFSRSALTLTPRECGPHYKELAVSFAPGASQARLTEFFAKNSDLRDVQVSVYKKFTQQQKGETVEEEKLIDTSLDRGLAILYARREEENIDYAQSVHVPVGSEVSVAFRLRQSGLFSSFDLTAGGCGGSERSFFVVKRNFLFSNDEFLREKFISFVEQTLTSFASKDSKGVAWSSLIGQPTIKKITVPPYSSSFRVKMATASEVTRRAPGAWDSFFVSFEPTDLPAIAPDEYGVVVTVERLKLSKRSSGSSVPPDDSYFKEVKEDEANEAEAEVTTAISSFFSRQTKGGWCFFETEGAPATKAKCDNSDG